MVYSFVRTCGTLCGLWTYLYSDNDRPFARDQLFLPADYVNFSGKRDPCFNYNNRTDQMSFKMMLRLCFLGTLIAFCDASAIPRSSPGADVTGKFVVFVEFTRETEFSSGIRQAQTTKSTLLSLGNYARICFYGMCYYWLVPNPDWQNSEIKLVYNFFFLELV